MERRTLTDCPVDGFRLVGVGHRIDVGFHRAQQLPWGVWELPQDCLASNDDELVFAYRVRCRPDDVLELGSSHPAAISITRRRSGSLKTPVNGEFWRRSRPV